MRLGERDGFIPDRIRVWPVERSAQRAFLTPIPANGFVSPDSSICNNLTGLDT
jgi:hypothetical protein